MEGNTYFLYPATLFVSKEPYLINTILGSCVSVCLYDPKLKLGGMNHYMLPFWNGQGLASPKYGNIAIDKLLDRMLELGSHKINLQAKVFGGGEVIDTQISNYHIGERNIKMAFEQLQELKIPVVSSSTGGKQGRKIQFYTENGSVMQKFIQRQNGEQQ